jgi:hypothetical protein
MSEWRTNWHSVSSLAISAFCLIGGTAVMFGWRPSIGTLAFVAFSGCGRAWLEASYREAHDRSTRR